MKNINYIKMKDGNFCLYQDKFSERLEGHLKDMVHPLFDVSYDEDCEGIKGKQILIVPEKAFLSHVISNALKHDNVVISSGYIPDISVISNDMEYGSIHNNMMPTESILSTLEIPYISICWKKDGKDSNVIFSSCGYDSNGECISDAEFEVSKYSYDLILSYNIRFNDVIIGLCSDNGLDLKSIGKEILYFEMNKNIIEESFVYSASKLTKNRVQVGIPNTKDVKLFSGSEEETSALYNKLAFDKIKNKCFLVKFFKNNFNIDTSEKKHFFSRYCNDAYSDVLKISTKSKIGCNI